MATAKKPWETRYQKKTYQMYALKYRKDSYEDHQIVQWIDMLSDIFNVPKGDVIKRCITFAEKHHEQFLDEKLEDDFFNQNRK